MTDEELDALDEVYDTMMEVQRNPTGAWQAIQDQADIITTLRAQLAGARADFEDCNHVRQFNKDRTDRAEQRVATLEAALAAQIEADAEISKRLLEDEGVDLQAISDEYRDAMVSGMHRGRKMPKDFAKECAKEFQERSDAVYQMGEHVATAIRNQPHDRTALDRYR